MQAVGHVTIRHFDKNGVQMPGPPNVKNGEMVEEVSRFIRFIHKKAQQANREEGRAVDGQQGSV